MRIDLTSLMFNMEIAGGGGTPSWGTALGQSVKEEHRFTYNGYESIIIGMVYKKVAYEDVYCPLGKGGNKQNDYEYVLAGVFDKIYVNDVFVPEASFVLLIVKQLKAQVQQHIGRRTLKYGRKMTYMGKEINEDCFKKIRGVLSIGNEAAWFISDIDIVNQDELHFSARIVDEKKPVSFYNSEERKKFCENRANVIEEKEIIAVQKVDDEIDYAPIIIKNSKSIEIKF